MAFADTLLSQFLTCPTFQHIGTAKRILRYIQGTKEHKLIFPYDQPLVLEGYSDLSFGSCKDTRRSISRYIFKLGNATISWRSRKQRSVATSTLEAEYMACSQGAKHHIWLERALTELSCQTEPGYIYSALSCDNSGTIDLTENLRIGDRS